MDQRETWTRRLIAACFLLALLALLMSVARFPYFSEGSIRESFAWWAISVLASLLGRSLSPDSHV